MRKPHPTDLSDAEWKYIEPHMPVERLVGHLEFAGVEPGDQEEVRRPE
jgi:hypothetical protein